MGVPDEDLNQRLLGLGMERIGRVWATPDRRVSFERPGTSLEPRAKAIDAESPSGRRLRVLSLEDTIISRMDDLDGGAHFESWNQALTLLHVPGLDRARLEKRAREEKLTHVLERLDWAATEVEGGSHLRCV